MPAQSWIVVRTKDGEAVMETFNPKAKALAERTPGHCVLSAIDWLGAFNRAAAMSAGMKIELNGGLAYRNGADLADNPFDKDRRNLDWLHWRQQFFDEQSRRVGKASNE